MGVRGLQSFLKQNPQLSKRCDLQNTTLIIDANNLKCAIYTNSTSSLSSTHYRCDINGGDMVSYGNELKEFFNALKMCNIKPIMIFDGSVIGKQSTNDQVALKDKTILKRALDKFNAVGRVQEREPGETIFLPQLMNSVMKQVLVDFGIETITTPFEADTYIARLAQDHDCFLLSNDSDFIIYRLPKGFILLDTFSYRNVITKKNGVSSIPCTVYSQALLTKVLPNLQIETLPMLSILLGNDYVESHVFDRFLNKVSDHLNRSRFCAETRAHRRIGGLLIWLQGKTVGGVIDKILEECHAGSQQTVAKSIRAWLKSYCTNTDYDLEKELFEMYPRIEDNAHDTCPVQYLMDLSRKDKLSPKILDIVFHNTHYEYCNVDDHSLPTSNVVKFRPLSFLVTVLRKKSYSGYTTYQRQVHSNKDAFLWYDRFEGQYSMLAIKPMLQLDDFGSIEHLNIYTLSTLDETTKKDMFMALFRYTQTELMLFLDSMSQIFTGPFVRDSAISLILVKYVSLETRKPNMPEFVNALLLDMLYYASCNDCINKDNVTIDLGPMIEHTRPLTTRTYPLKPPDWSPCLYRRATHFIAQLIAAMDIYSVTERLLGLQTEAIKYQLHSNTILMYNLTKSLKLGKLKLESLLGNSDVIPAIFATARTMVHCRE